MKVRGGRLENRFPFILEKRGFQIADSPLVEVSGNAVARASSFQDHSLKVDFWIYYDVGSGYNWVPIQLTGYGKKPTSRPNMRHGSSLEKKLRDCKKRGVLLVALNYPRCIQASKDDLEALEEIALKVQHAIERHFAKLRNPLTYEVALEIERQTKGCSPMPLSRERVREIQKQLKEGCSNDFGE